MQKKQSPLFFSLGFLIIEPPCCCCLLLPYLPFSRIFLTQKRICCYHFEDFMGKISERADLGEFLLLPCPACFTRTLCARECVLVPAFGNTFFESKLLPLLLRESSSFPERWSIWALADLVFFISNIEQHNRSNRWFQVLGLPLRLLPSILGCTMTTHLSTTKYVKTRVQDCSLVLFLWISVPSLSVDFTISFPEPQSWFSCALLC